MSGRIGRDHQSRRNYTQQHQRGHHHSSSSFRSDENKPSRGKNPPSRHLWVGNLSHNIAHSTLTDQFILFGELENIAFHPGRSYAFVNFVRDEDAIAALKSLQGFSLAGMPLRIEFAKSDKSSAPPRDEMYSQRRDELQPSNRGSAYSPRGSRKRHASPDAYVPDTPRTIERGTDQPSEILWIGFPAFMKVDETILRKAFSPFGVIEKITAFPGRTYAFVQFRDLSSACRAKETLQGKLFGNPRVHISFARKEHASSTGGRRIMGPNAPLSPHLKSSVQAGSSDNLRRDRNAGELDDPSIRAHQFRNRDYGDPDIMNFDRKESSWGHTSAPYDDRRFHELGPDVGPPQGLQGYGRSPFRDGNAHLHDFSPRKNQGKIPFPEDPWDLPEDSYSYHGAKKLKIDSFPHDNELPEYPLYNVDQDKHSFPGVASELPLSDRSRPPLPFRRPSDSWRSSHDTFHSPPPPSSSMPVEWKRTMPELRQPGPKEWKWEGTIAKGGTPVCRARCFPVGKVMDFILPEFLDCTARTGLDMLAKHYYQAACSWVVFFVPAGDADMGYYNELMHYLSGKQRAAVTKLDDRNTLFLVPPSDFSQNVLKVPGKLSISGVVLSLEPTSPGLASHPPVNEMKDRGLNYLHVDTSYSKLESLSGPPSYPNLEKSGVNTSVPSLFPGYGHGTGSNAYHVENQHNFQPSHPVSRDLAMQAFPISEGYNPVSVSSGPEFGRFNYGQKLPSSVPLPLGGSQQDQHADVASSLRGPTQRQTANFSRPGSEALRSSSLIENQPEGLSRVPPTYIAQQTTNQGPSDMSPSPFGQVQQQLLQQAENVRAFSHAQASQEAVNVGNAQDEGEADPQKRLQATLQLAAALLQQIQQGKGT